MLIESEALAGHTQPGAEESGALTLLNFDLGGQLLAVDVRQVREILDLQEIARIPNAERDVIGVIDVRGEGIAVVDLAARLGVMPGDEDRDARIIVLELGDEGERRVRGFRADRVIDVTQVPPAAIEPVPVSSAVLGGSDAVTGMTRFGEGLFMILDLEAVLGRGAL